MNTDDQAQARARQLWFYKFQLAWRVGRFDNKTVEQVKEECVKEEIRTLTRIYDGHPLPKNIRAEMMGYLKDMQPDESWLPDDDTTFVFQALDAKWRERGPRSTG